MRFLELTRDSQGIYDVGTGQSGRGPDTLINPAHIVQVRAKGWRSQRTSIPVGSGFNSASYTLNMAVQGLRPAARELVALNRIGGKPHYTRPPRPMASLALRHVPLRSRLSSGLNSPDGPAFS